MQLNNLKEIFPRIYFAIKILQSIYINQKMEKKNHLLSNLKRQVIALKLQLEGLEKKKGKSFKNHQSIHNKSITYSSRFDSVSLDCSYLDKGIKKFPEKENRFYNIAELIDKKSQPTRIPTFSSHRKQEHLKTIDNFSTDHPEQSKSRSRSPNPITGEGYPNKTLGIKTQYQPRAEKKLRSQ